MLIIDPTTKLFYDIKSENGLILLNELKNNYRVPLYDNTIPNPINVVSPWMNTTIPPDLERRPLDCFISEEGLYSRGPTGCNANGTYVGRSITINLLFILSLL